MDESIGFQERKSYQAGSIEQMNWSPSILLILLIILLVVFLLVLNKLQSGEDKTKIILSLVAALIVCATGILWPHLMPKENPADYVSQNRPYLSAQLHIYNADSDGFNWQFILKNVGRLPAERLVLGCAADGMMLAEFMVPPPGKRELSPSTEMKFGPPPIKSRVAPDGFDSFRLVAYYEATIEGQPKYFCYYFKTILPARDVKNGLYSGEITFDHPGKLRPKEMLSLLK